MLVLSLLHISPLAHESVAWISGRTHLLCALFVLLSTSSFLAWLRTGRRLSLVCALLTFFCALLSYEAAIYQLPFLGLLAWLARGELPLRPRRLVSTLAASLAVLAAYLVLRTVALHGVEVGFYPDRELLWPRLAAHLSVAYAIVARWSGLGLPLLLSLVLGLVFCPR